MERVEPAAAVAEHRTLTCFVECGELWMQRRDLYRREAEIRKTTRLIFENKIRRCLAHR